MYASPAQRCSTTRRNGAVPRTIFGKIGVRYPEKIRGNFYDMRPLVAACPNANRPSEFRKRRSRANGRARRRSRRWPRRLWFRSLFSRAGLWKPAVLRPVLRERPGASLERIAIAWTRKARWKVAEEALTLYIGHRQAGKDKCRSGASASAESVRPSWKS